jgi:hypothetical protein
MGLFDKIFKTKTSKSLSNSTLITPKIEINFDELVTKAKSSGSSSDLGVLYEAFFRLKEWTFIVSNNCTMENAKPFIGVFEEQPWLYVFTDSKKADSYARLFGNFLTKDGSIFIIKMTKEGSLNMIKELHQRGVFGLRINEGDNGWFSTIPGLFEIKDYLKVE